jgi:prepilin-type N-terminal cleavage/methylation domain-containing protein
MTCRCCKPSHRRDQGFSLLEVLLVLAVVALLTVVVASSMNPFLATSRETLSDRLRESISSARITALATRSVVDVDLSEFDLCPDTKANIQVRANGTILASPICIDNTTYTIDWMTGDISSDVR